MAEKKEKAVALQYNEVDDLPRVTAVGFNYVAERIIELAKKNNVPVYSDNTLIDLLSTVPVGQTVPEEGLALVSEIISFFCHVDQKAA